MITMRQDGDICDGMDYICSTATYTSWNHAPMDVVTKTIGNHHLSLCTEKNKDPKVIQILKNKLYKKCLVF